MLVFRRRHMSFSPSTLVCAIKFLCVCVCICVCGCLCVPVCMRALACVRWPECAHALLVVLASSRWHVCLRQCLCLHPFSSMCFCTCASSMIASASLHEARQHHLRVMSKGLCRRSWSIRESSARGARAKILVYIYIYIYYNHYNDIGAHFFF